MKDRLAELATVPPAIAFTSTAEMAKDLALEHGNVSHPNIICVLDVRNMLYFRSMSLGPPPMCGLARPIRGCHPGWRLGFLGFPYAVAPGGLTVSP
jgi:hypothetical protein